MHGGRKRKAPANEEPERFTKLTSKEKRRIERSQKIKKVGVRYYDTHNVKNKNKDRKVSAEANKGKRAKR